MVDSMTTLISGIITSIGTLLDPSGGGSDAVAYVALLAMPVLAGIVVFARRLVKKAKN